MLITILIKEKQDKEIIENFFKTKEKFEIVAINSQNPNYEEIKQIAKTALKDNKHFILFPNLVRLSKNNPVTYDISGNKNIPDFSHFVISFQENKTFKFLSSRIHLETKKRIFFFIRNL